MSEPSYYSFTLFTTKFSFRKENHLREIYTQLRFIFGDFFLNYKKI